MCVLPKKGGLIWGERGLATRPTAPKCKAEKIWEVCLFWCDTPYGKQINWWCLGYCASTTGRLLGVHHSRERKVMKCTRVYVFGWVVYKTTQCTTSSSNTTHIINRFVTKHYVAIICLINNATVWSTSTLSGQVTNTCHYSMLIVWNGATPTPLTYSYLSVLSPSWLAHFRPPLSLAHNHVCLCAFLILFSEQCLNRLGISLWFVLSRRWGSALMDACWWWCGCCDNGDRHHCRLGSSGKSCYIFERTLNLCVLCPRGNNNTVDKAATTTTSTVLITLRSNGTNNKTD